MTHSRKPFHCPGGTQRVEVAGLVSARRFHFKLIAAGSVGETALSSPSDDPPPAKWSEASSGWQSEHPTSPLVSMLRTDPFTSSCPSPISGLVWVSLNQVML